MCPCHEPRPAYAHAGRAVRRATDLEWLQWHANRAHVGTTRWLPTGVWQTCRADYEVADDELLTLGVDVGGSRSTTTLVGCVADEDGVRIALVDVRTGRDAVLVLAASIRELADVPREVVSG